MKRTIKTFNKNLSIEFDFGGFDQWCVFVNRNGKRYAPKDIEYFQILKDIATEYGVAKVHDDFILIYERTTAYLDNSILNLITHQSKSYLKHEPEFDLWMSVVYAGMVAEENKMNAILKKRIKRLGVTQVLMEDISPAIAAEFSKGKTWRELDVIMKGKGF